MLRGFVLGCALLALNLGGCGGGSKTAYITQFPEWNWESYDRVAVLPFRYPPGKRGAESAAQQATYMFQDMLAANGRFTVLERGALRDVLSEQDLSLLADTADPATVLAPGRVQIAQAIIVGSITQCDTRAERVEKRRPVFAKNRRGRIIRDRHGRPIVVREEIRTYFRHEATVSGSVRVIDAATGRIVFSHRVQPITFDDSQQGAPPRASPSELAIEAAKELAVDCYTHIAPIRAAVKLKGDSLIVALDYYDGQYDKAGKIPAELDTFLLAVRRLPRSCDRNSFRVAIAPENGRNIFEREFVWSTNNPTRGEVFEIPVDLLRQTGQEKFEAKLYSAGSESPLLKRGFKLKQPEN